MIRLYPPVKVARQSFIGVKRVTVPNQSMSLRDILKRFVRRESLPVMREGIYEERFGDLEKLKHADITEQLEVVEDLKKRIDDFNKRIIAQQEKQKQEAADRAAALSKLTEPPTTGGAPPINSPPPKVA